MAVKKINAFSKSQIVLGLWAFEISGTWQYNLEISCKTNECVYPRSFSFLDPSGLNLSYSYGTSYTFHLDQLSLKE